MNNRPTPGTDELRNEGNGDTFPILGSRARTEQQRDEAREELKKCRKELRAANRGAETNAKINNSLVDKLITMRRELDEIRDELARMRSKNHGLLGRHPCSRQGGLEMTDRPTPETDAATLSFLEDRPEGGRVRRIVVDVELCECLERERDLALENLEEARTKLREVLQFMGRTVFTAAREGKAVNWDRDRASVVSDLWSEFEAEQDTDERINILGALSEILDNNDLEVPPKT